MAAGRARRLASALREKQKCSLSRDAGSTKATVSFRAATFGAKQCSQLRRRDFSGGDGMGTRTKLLVTLALVCAWGALALPSMAIAKARSGVTIHLDSGGTFMGFVFSPKPGRCADGRTVELYRRTGKGQRPRRDQRMRKTEAQSHGHDRFKWSLYPSHPRPGDFYARVPRTADCLADNSKTLHLAERPNTKITGMSVTHGRNVTFKYRGSGGVPPYNFQCKLDHKPYRHCSPRERRYVHLSHGHHVFKVRARNDLGKQDRTPARRGFRI
jgi:hypothetical protein